MLTAEAKADLEMPTERMPNLGTVTPLVILSQIIESETLITCKLMEVQVKLI